MYVLMNKIILFLIIFISFQALSSEGNFNIENNNPELVSEKDVLNLEKTLIQGHAYFFSMYAQFPDKEQRKYKIIIGGEGLSTGYNFKTKSINFPNKKNIQHFGIRSKSVVLHELFHRLLCEVNSSICHEGNHQGESRIVHEALADYFTYLVINNPKNKCFGENYYVNRSCIRRWDVNFDYALVKSSYSKSSLLTKYFIEKRSDLYSLIEQTKITPLRVKNLIDINDQSLFYLAGGEIPRFSLEFNGQPVSRTNRYKVSKSSLTTFKTRANTRFQNKYTKNSLKWVHGQTLLDDSLCSQVLPEYLPKKFSFGKRSEVYEVRTHADRRAWEKVIMLLCSDERLIGFDSYYLKVVK